MSSRVAVHCLRVPRGWDGNVDALPLLAWTSRDDYIPPTFLECIRGPRLVRVRVPEDVRGGRKYNGDPFRATLFVEMDNTYRKFVRFVWLTAERRFTPAHGAGGPSHLTDNMGSLYVHVVRDDVSASERLTVHALLGWTFKCPIVLGAFAWSANYVIDHFDNDHNNNHVDNLEVVSDSVHRKQAGRQGGRAGRGRGRGRRARGAMAGPY